MEQIAREQNGLRDLELLKAAIDAHAIVAVTDAYGVITHANEKFCQISGYTVEELIGNSHRIINSGQHPREFFANMWRTIAAGEIWKGEVCNRAKDGSIYWVDTVIVPMDVRQGRPRKFVSIRTDITQRKRAEQAKHIVQERRYQRLYERLHAIWENEPHGVFISDADTVVHDINPAGLGLLRLQELPAMARVAQFIHPDDRAQFLAGHARAIAGERVVDRLRLAVSPPTWVEHTSVPLPSGSLGLKAVLSVFSDISLQLQAEQTLQLHRQELETMVQERTSALLAANEELEAYAGVVSHDLRAPLTVMASFSEVIANEAGPQLDPRSKDALKRIQRAVQRMQDMIAALLALSSVTHEGLRIEEVDLSDAATQVLDELRVGAPDRPVSWEVEQGLRAHGDPRLLRQVLENLLGNAWKFTGGRQSAHISFGQAVPRDGGAPAFFVRDNGAGFDPRYYDDLFRAFRRLHSDKEFPGTGVGLTTVQRIVRLHGGSIWAESSPGEGAVFWFRLQGPARSPA